jgi:adenylylsulfate kinase
MLPSRCRIIWFTGLSGSGKSTLAGRVLTYLTTRGVKSRLIDGDDVRKSMKVQKFTKSEIIQNNESVIQLCNDIKDEFEYLLVAVIAPFNQTRQKARETFSDNYTEVYVKASIEILKTRDTKGLYQKALSGRLSNLIGVDPKVPYEEPQLPELVIDTDKETVETSVKKIVKFISNKTKL